MTVLTWSDERVEQLKKLWESGLSASQIAAELGNAEHVFRLLEKTKAYFARHQL